MIYFFIGFSKILILIVFSIFLSAIILLFSYLLSVSASYIKKLFFFMREFGPYEDTRRIFIKYHIKFGLFLKIVFFKFNTFKTYFAKHIQKFCFERSIEIFSCFCGVYFLFLWCQLNLYVALVFFFFHLFSTFFFFC